MYFDKTIKFIYDSVFDGKVRVIYYHYLTYNYNNFIRYYHVSLLVWISYFDCLWLLFFHMFI